jgi:hypothetical protein
MPCILRADERWSACFTSGNSSFFATATRAMIPKISIPSPTWRMFEGSASPIKAPAMEAEEAISATGKAILKSAIPFFSRPGLATNALERAISRPVPHTKSRWNGKKAPTTGTKSTAPPMPPSTATTPSEKAVMNNINGHPHQGIKNPAEAVGAVSGIADANTTTLTRAIVVTIVMILIRLLFEKQKRCMLRSIADSCSRYLIVFMTGARGKRKEPHDGAFYYCENCFMYSPLTCV